MAFFFASRRRHTRCGRDWSSDVCSSDLILYGACCLAAWELRRRDVQSGCPPLRVPGSGPIPLAACIPIAWILTSVTRQEGSRAAGVLAVASLLFLATGRRRSVARATSPDT